MTHTGSGRAYAGFGFGAIQGGLFLLEAFDAGVFDRLTVAEVVPGVVDAVRAAGGAFRVNVASADGVRARRVEGLEILNPNAAADAGRLVERLAAASEIGTALPSVDFYERGDPSPADLLAAAVLRKAAGEGPPCVVYTAENHNHAAEHLAAALARRGAGRGGVTPVPGVQLLNTVVGKMSGVVTDAADIARDGLATVTPGSSRAFRVEAFNRILVSRVERPGFRRGLSAFVEKPDLLPFEEAKLYGHNAVHALLGFLAVGRGHRFMSDIAGDAALLAFGRAAFLEESGGALLGRHAGVDPLFTEAGYRAYAEDLLARMLNPWLRDAVDRVIRDPRRKLGWDDRLVGTMRLALAAGIEPRRFALGAAAAVRALAREEPGWDADRVARELWPREAPEAERRRVRDLVAAALARRAGADGLP